MARLLFAWELGGNLGHLNRDMPIARELCARGHDVLFAVNDISLAQLILGPEGIGFVQAPYPRIRSPKKGQWRNYGDLLCALGFHEGRTLESLTAAWRHLMRACRADVLIADHSPAALLGARLASIPAVQVGTGFSLPPPVEPLPVIRPWIKEAPRKQMRDEKALVANINALLGNAGRPKLRHLHELYATELALLATIPELDHFPARKGGRYVGAIFELDAGAGIAWPGSRGKRIFAYLRPGEHLAVLLEGLRDSGANVIACVPGADRALVARFAGKRMVVSPDQVTLKAILPDADLVVSHAGIGLASACMALGVPMICIPDTPESFLVASRVVEQGAGLGVGLVADDIPGRFATAVRKIFTRPGIRKSAQRIARKYADYQPAQAVGLIADAIEALPGVGKQARSA